MGILKRITGMAEFALQRVMAGVDADKKLA